MSRSYIGSARPGYEDRLRSKWFITHVLELGVEMAFTFAHELDGTGDVPGVFERTERRSDRRGIVDG